MECKAGQVGIDTAEQRRWPRVGCGRELVIHPIANGLIAEPISVQAHDFATMGMGLLHHRPMQKGDQFLVPLATRSGPPLPLLYTVVHCRQLGHGQYHIGAELVSVFNLDEFARGRLPHQSLAEYLSDAVCADD